MSVFVTVGTTSFDQLIEITSCPEFHAALYHLGYRKLTVQHGDGLVIPAIPSQQSITGIAHTHYSSENLHPLLLDAYNYKPDIGDDMASADMVISHGGAGTCLQALTPPGARRLIVVINETLAGNHQQELALRLARDGHAVITKPELLVAVLRFGINETTCPFPGVPFKCFPSDVIKFLGPTLPPERAGFVAFQRGDPKRLVDYIDTCFDRAP